MTNRILILLLSLVYSSSASSQSELSWFDAASDTEKEYIKATDLDCMISNNQVINGNEELENIKFNQREFFVYTNPQVKKYLPNANLMEVTAAVNQVGKNIFLILKYKINSEKAKTNYGNLEKGGKVKATLSNKDHIYLENIERSRGKVKRSDRYTTYEGTYAITKSNYNMLRKHNLDKLTVLWEEGVEEYEIHNIDLVRNQLNYLDKLK